MLYLKSYSHSREDQFVPWQILTRSNSFKLQITSDGTTARSGDPTLTSKLSVNTDISEVGIEISF